MFVTHFRSNISLSLRRGMSHCTGSECGTLTWLWLYWPRRNRVCAATLRWKRVQKVLRLVSLEAPERRSDELTKAAA